MSMDTAEEAMAPINNNNSSSSTNENKEEDHSSHAVVKRKRTKRQRFLLHLPPPNLITTTSSASSSEFSGSTTEEEEDMANCLILLAQGKALESGPKMEEEAGGGGGAEKFTSSRRFAEAATTTNGKAGFYVYECKTCNKCFSSFQALGGHRASHKKPKMMAVAAAAAAADEDKKAMDEDSLQISIGCFPKPIMLPHNTTSNNKSRVHECSICGSEFSSGQALGGHMRRHRSVIIPESQEVKDKNILSLDLNLPAPSEEDDHAGDFPKSPSSSSFAFASKQPLIFSASALVDCHY